METAQRIFDDLLSLEINVVLKPGMTARKMPDPPYALLDIIGEYDGYVCRHSATLNAAWAERLGDAPVPVRPPQKEKDAPALSRRQTDPDGALRTGLRVQSVGNDLSFETFDELRERAVEAEAVYKALTTAGFADDGTGIILKRIYRNCDQIKGIVGRPEMRKAMEADGIPTTLPLRPDEIIVIRKAWDVGTETVMMQTVAQLDGDVITRIQRGRESAANQAIHELHQEAVASALAHWQFLVRTVSEFLTQNVRSFFLR
ncbi:MAG: hypothetical protein ACRD12_06105 [Acidimicrobiales bacterium]